MFKPGESIIHDGFICSFWKNFSEGFYFFFLDTLKSVIAEGGFGKVYYAKGLGGSDLAFKFFKIGNKVGEKECEIMDKLPKSPLKCRSYSLIFWY
jgi:hypothetical protein